MSGYNPKEVIKDKKKEDIKKCLMIKFHILLLV